MMAFFLYDADQQDYPDHADNVQIRFEEHHGHQRAQAGRRQGGDNSQGMDQAFVEHSQDDIDGQQSGSDKDGLIVERFLVSLLAGEFAGDVHGQANFHFGPVDGVHGIAQGHILGEIKGKGGGRELSLMGQAYGRDALREMGEGGQGNVAALGSLYVNRF